MLVVDIAHQVRATSARAPLENAASIARAHAVVAIPERTLICGCLQTPPSVGWLAMRVTKRSGCSFLTRGTNAKRNSDRGCWFSHTTPRMHKLSHRRMPIAVSNAGKPRVRPRFHHQIVVNRVHFWRPNPDWNRCRRRACGRLSARGFDRSLRPQVFGVARGQPLSGI